MDIDRYEALLEALRSGSPSETLMACEELIRLWKEVPVEELLLLKNRFGKLGLDDREARLDEALVSIAEKRPAPFTEIVTVPDHPLWPEAVDVLSMLGCEDFLELFISLLPSCPEKSLVHLIRAIGCYRENKVVESLARYLRSDDEEVFMEAVLAIKRCGGPQALGILQDVRRSRNGSDIGRILDVVIEELEMNTEPDTAEA